MSLTRCPECRKKISENAKNCPNCGFSFKQKDLEMYKQRLEAQRLHNEEVNRKSTKLHIIWFCIFAIFIAVTSWMVN
ncbi:TPA: zinc ribbon domain-containing protein [Haemophilus influenzae]|uniref:zinc ribbon domain-containing protein n=1 Tax=Haemophilus influenzae TaxID=727 RepID=UPI000DD47D75|nr:zinc ribbon domain-containing protein [Haemophilus influenzae]MBZ5690317.1 zinc ribbon domain-containing protein [Haemophilus influenzae]MCK8913280.1 zinc ribbon domain-containing protein [Haemophilus influenzae]MCK8922138.1 zinc ribbon domain-containing protein [Haemophilus influenzae]MCK9642169.1 zinc ribbon domain-containing protein [Haemophilus influenzae]